jgi:hypothetical protein
MRAPNAGAPAGNLLESAPGAKRIPGKFLLMPGHEFRKARGATASNQCQCVYALV